MEFVEELETVKKTHIPSYSRKLIKLSKSVLAEKDKLDIILEHARELPDKYYTAFVLVNIARELEKAEFIGYEELFKEAAEILENITPEWRKVEIFELVISKMGQADVDEFQSLFKIFDTIEKPELRTELARKMLKQMFKTGSDNYIHLIERAQTVYERSEFIKLTANEMERSNYSHLEKLEPIILKIDDKPLRAKLFSYLGYKSEKMKTPGGNKYFDIALDIALTIKDESNQLDIFRYLVDNIKEPHMDRLVDISNYASRFKDKLNEAKLMGFIGGRVFNSDNRLGREYFKKSIDLLKSITDTSDKARAVINIGIGLKRSDLDLADEVFDMASEIARKLPGDEREIIEHRITNALAKIERIKGKDPKRSLTGDIHQHEPRQEKNKDNPYIDVNSKTQISDYPVLGLYNTYEKNLSSAHIRAIARAAPLCWAYDLNLGIFNFPFENLKSMIEKVRSDTSIGKGGDYLIKLVENNRIIQKNTIDFENIGLIFITTPKPDEKKTVTIQDISHIHGKKCFLMGVGKTGLPKSVLEKADYHLEFTGKGIEIETCTAMGILAYILKLYQ